MLLWLKTSVRLDVNKWCRWISIKLYFQKYVLTQEMNCMGINQPFAYKIKIQFPGLVCRIGLVFERESSVCYIWGLNILKFPKYSKASIYPAHLVMSWNATFSAVPLFLGTRSRRTHFEHLRKQLLVC